MGAAKVTGAAYTLAVDPRITHMKSCWSMGFLIIVSFVYQAIVWPGCAGPNNRKSYHYPSPITIILELRIFLSS
jgi:hypothetical protein